MRSLRLPLRPYPKRQSRRWCRAPAEHGFPPGVFYLSAGEYCSPPIPKEMTMSQRNLVLGSVASLALAGTMIAAGAGYAQSLPRYPTRAEQAQTEALNAEQ